MASGHIITKKRHTKLNVMRRTNANPRLDSKLCQVEFQGGEITELTTNVIAESMYIQCDAEVN